MVTLRVSLPVLVHLTPAIMWPTTFPPGFLDRPRKGLNQRCSSEDSQPGEIIYHPQPLKG